MKGRELGEVECVTSATCVLPVTVHFKSDSLQALLLSLQLPVGVGPTGVPLGSLRTAFLCTLLLSSGAQLLSLLFRISEVPAGVRVVLSWAEHRGRPA